MQPVTIQHQKFTEKDFQEGMIGNLNGLRSVPKVDLHAHSTLSTPFKKVKAIEPTVSQPPGDFSDFAHFMGYIKENYYPIYRNADKVWQLHEACLKGMVEDGVIYTEMSYDLSTPSRMNVSWDEHSQMIQEQLHKVSDSIKVCCELGIKREIAPKDLEELLPKALDTGMFSSVDLYGDYLSATVDSFKDALLECRKNGLKVKIHSGEFLSSDRIEEDLSAIAVDGVQHGITIVNKPHLMEKYAKLQIPFNVCPTSSVKLSHVSSYAKHPIRAMFDAGLNVTIGTDDISIFNSTLSEEYLHLFKSGLFSVNELNSIRQNGLRVFKKQYEITT